MLAVRDGGGECTVDNMQVLCVACHHTKTQQERKRRSPSKSHSKSASPSPRKPKQARASSYFTQSQ